ncbi:MAG: hypothetical protein IJ713_06070 [Oscillibacter sp.]|nr:hypothetical protein [Oscillibacter sp.]
MTEELILFFGALYAMLGPFLWAILILGILALAVAAVILAVLVLRELWRR